LATYRRSRFRKTIVVLCDGSSESFTNVTCIVTYYKYFYPFSFKTENNLTAFKKLSSLLGAGTRETERVLELVERREVMMHFRVMRCRLALSTVPKRKNRSNLQFILQVPGTGFSSHPSGAQKILNGGLTQSLSPPTAVPAFSFTRFCEQVHNARK
jgi:hypothetical protein